MTRIAVVGVGAIGTYLANRLHRAGHDVIAVARQEQASTLACSGVRVRVGKVVMTDHIEVVESLTSHPDLVLMTVKTQDLAAACESISETAQDVTTVTFQNGIQADSIVSSILGRDVIVGAIAGCAITCLKPGVITVNAPGWFTLGDPFGCTKGRLASVANTVGEVASTSFTPDLAAARWTKLLANLANGVCAATGLSVADLGRSPTGRKLVFAVMAEGYRVIVAAHIKLDYHILAKLLLLALRTSVSRADFRGSTWQSLARGRPTEIDYLNGEIVRLGAGVGVETPYNAHIVAAVHAAEQTNTSCTVIEQRCHSVR